MSVDVFFNCWEQQRSTVGNSNGGGIQIDVCLLLSGAHHENSVGLRCDADAVNSCSCLPVQQTLPLNSIIRQHTCDSTISKPPLYGTLSHAVLSCISLQ